MPDRKKIRGGSTGEIVDGAGGVAGAFIGEAATKHLAEATDRVFRDSRELQRVVDQFANCDVELTQGRAFEFIEVLKFNRQAAEQRSVLEAAATHFDAPHSPADILIRKGKEIVREVQAKSSNHPSYSVAQFLKDKYEGMGRLVPVDREAGVSRLLDNKLRIAPEEALNRQGLEDTRRNLMGRLEHGGVASSGTTRAEAEFAARYPDLAALCYEGEAALKEVGVAAGQGAVVAGGFGAIYHTVSNGWMVGRGEKTHGDAIIDAAAGTAAAAARGGTVTGMARAVAVAARQIGIKGLAEGAAPVAVANTVYEAGHATYRYLRGEFSAEEYRDEAGGAVLRSASMFYCGMAGQLLIPIPVVGGLVGSLVGYSASAIMLQSGILGIGANNIVAVATRRREEIEAECFAAIERMAFYQAAADQITSEYQLQYRDQLLPSLVDFETGLMDWNPNAAIIALSRLNLALGKSLPWGSFEEFDAFMEDPDTVLKI